jgi:hypothetical protein
MSVAPAAFRAVSQMVPDIVVLPVGSAFSRAVYELLRPKIPRTVWPDESIKAAFTPSSNGLYFDVRFDGFQTSYAMLAAHLVREANVKLVLLSPCFVEAKQVMQARRWRDAFLYSAVPLLFAIPLLAALSETAMRLSSGLFALDAVLLTLSHGLLMTKRSALLAKRFVADIPVPGLRLKAPTNSGVARQPLEP